jgi:hypothetical protein
VDPCLLSSMPNFYFFIFLGEVLSALFTLGGLVPIIFKSVYDYSRFPVWFCSCVWQLVLLLFLYSTYAVLLLHGIHV